MKGEAVSEPIHIHGICRNPATCVNCGRCLTACPSKITSLTFPPADAPPEQQIQAYCIRCGHCMAVCPTKSIQVDGLSYEHMADVVPSSALSPQSIRAYVQSRRSYRTFRDELVPQNTIAELLYLTRYSASAHNQHRIQWGVIRGKERIRELADAIIEEIQGESFYRDLVQAYHRGNNRLTRDASHIILAYMPKNALLPTEDATVAMTLLEWLLPAYGLGGCWAGYLTGIGQNVDAVSRLLHVPQRSILVGAMLMGYPGTNETYLRIPERKKPDIIWIE